MKSFRLQNAANLKESWQIEPHVIAHHILPLKDKEEFRGQKILLISLDEESGYLFRYKLYGFSALPGLEILDAGDHHGGPLHELADLIKWAYYEGIIPVLVSREYSDKVFELLEECFYEKERINLSHISRKLFVYPGARKVRKIVNIAYQTHRTIPEHLAIKYEVDLYRLGEVRRNLSEVEPFIRFSDWVYFDLNAMRFGDAPGQSHPSSSGLFSEEACQIAKYAGASEFVKLFWLYGYDPQKDQDKVTADLMAQILWYFAQGVAARRNETTINPDTMRSFIVEYSGIDIPLTFHRSEVTGRWWVEYRNGGTPRVSPCSANDYQLAKSDELSDRLIKLLGIYT